MNGRSTSDGARDRRIAAALQRWFGFDGLRPLQREVVDAALDGRDALVVMPTGGGKSLCYQLPALIMDRLTVVVSPLIALMQDQVDGLRLLGVPAAAVHGNLDAGARATLRELAASQELRLLFVAPERLFQDSFLRWLAEQDVAAFAIDEAHCISQWGHDFRVEYRRLAELRERFPGVPFHAFTATATSRVREDIHAQLRLREPAVVVGTFDRPELCYRVLPRQDPVQQVAEAIARHPDSAAIVYCIARKDTEALAAALRERGIAADAYHAGLPAGERTRISADFRAERLPVVVATVAFGMGIDRSNVRLVVHAAMPRSLEHYQQETGRAGRDGLPAECLMLYSAADAAKWRLIMQRPGDGGGRAAAGELELLQAMQRFANGTTCRHRALSEHFGQAYAPDDCGACDVCLRELEAVPDADVIAQKILSAVARTGQRFGGSHVIDVLRGSRAAKVVERGHDRIPTFGLLRELPASRIGNFIDQLVDQEVLVRTDGEYPVLQLAEAARGVLSGERAVTLVVPRAALAQHGRRQRAERPGRGGGTAAVELDAAGHGLFEALRALRRTIAGELGVAPFMVFSDATLVEMVRLRPVDRDGLLDVRGVGERKLASFGERFAAAITAYCAANGIAAAAARVPAAAGHDDTVADEDEDEAAATTAAATIRSRVVTGTRTQQPFGRDAAHALFRTGAAVDEVAARIGRAVSTTAQYLVEWIATERPESIAPWVPPDVHRTVAAALEGRADARLKPVFEALGGRVPYELIRIVVAFERGTEADA